MARHSPSFSCLRAGSLGLIALLATTAASAQSPLYMPRAVKHAYANGTRALDGRPGPNFWQNHARYTIDVTAQPPNRVIHGTEHITYVNNSPDTLRELVFKLFLNVHKATAPRMGATSPDYLTAGEQVDSFAVNGQRAKWPTEYFTDVPVRIPTAVLPHDSVQLAVGWHYEISKRAGREGMMDSTTYYLAYFYPRVAVYDDYDGWDRMDFTGQQEFYSDFNDYDVTLHAPANFIVWGTGTLVDAAQVLQPEYLRRLTASFTSDQTVHVATTEDLTARRVTAGGSSNAWHFRAANVPDMAFGLSDHYDWDAGSVMVDQAGHRRASVQAAYNDTASDFHFVVQMARHALEFLSQDWPGVPYPYEKTTVFQGGAGMEYPMMVNDESYRDTTFSRFVALHELAHTYMPFYMGINETRYGFMDEGWATTFEYLFEEHDMGEAAAGNFYRQFRVNGWARDPSPLEDLPIITPEDVLKGVAYGNNAYGKPSLGYLAVKDLLGDALFRRCLHEYVARWHGKHPTPWDFFFTFDDAAGRDLNWFWRDWYFSNGYIDIGVKSVAPTRGGYVVTLENVGGFDAPVDVVLTYADGTSAVAHQTPAIWQANQKTARIVVRTRRALRSVDLRGGIWVDADSTNDHWTAR